MPDLFDNVPALVSEETDLQALEKEIAADFKVFERAGRETLEAMARLGRKLLKVKAAVGHGLFQGWLKRHCSFSLRSAQMYMQQAKAKCAATAHLEDRMAAAFAAGADAEEPDETEVTPDPEAQATVEPASESTQAEPPEETAGTGKKERKGHHGLPPDDLVAKLNSFTQRFLVRYTQLNEFFSEFLLYIAGRGQQDRPLYESWRRQGAELLMQFESMYAMTRREMAKDGPTLTPVEIDRRKVMRAASRRYAEMLRQFLGTEEGREETARMEAALGLLEEFAEGLK